MHINTTYKTNASGTGQILAKGGGKQRTVAYNQERSPDWNHGHAAGTLAIALGITRERARNITHVTTDSGGHTFGFVL